MIIEFIGLPGSGKTHLTSLLCEDSRFIAPKHKRITNIYRIKCLLSVFKSRVLFLYILKIIFSFKNVKNKLIRFKSLIYLEDYNSVSNVILVYDQHLIQNLISFQKTLNSKLKINELSSLLAFYNFPKDKIIVFNNVDLDIVFKRFKLRRNSDSHNKTLLDNYDDNELVKEMQQLLSIINYTLECLQVLDIEVICCKSQSNNEFKLLKDKILLLNK